MKFSLLGLIIALPLVTSAATPSIRSFTPSTTSVNSGQIISFSWNIADGGGASLLIPCVQGIKFKKADGSAFTCNTSYPFGTTDYIDLTVWNISGGTASFTARLTAKDASGVEVATVQRNLTTAVAPVASPLDSITGTTTIASWSPYTLSWASSVLDGVNLSISCSSKVYATSTTYGTGFLPCGTPIFASDLPGTGSVTLFFNNPAPTTENITLTIIPAMAPKVYNGAQTQSMTIAVDTSVPPDPVVTKFTAEGIALSRIQNAAPTTFSWTIEKSDGANLRVSCNDNVGVVITIANASSSPVCNTYAFSAPLPAQGTALISFTNKNTAREPITVSLIPASKKGGYDATQSRDLSLTILPPGMTSTAPTTTPTITSPSVSSPLLITTTGANAPSTRAKKAAFTKYLKRGSAGPEVRALQVILKKTPDIYPEGIVNGVYGSATERAVKRFQTKYQISNTKTPGYGTIGPKTRAFLNALPD